MNVPLGTVVGRLDRPSWGFYALAAGWAAVGVAHGVVEPGPVTPLVEAAIILGLAAGVGYAGIDLRTRPLSASGIRRALAVAVTLTAGFVLLAALVGGLWILEPGNHPDVDFMLLFAGALGSAVGTWIGLYEAQSREELAENRALTKLLKVNERVLRHNLRNELTVALGHLENLEDRIGAGDPDVERVRAHLWEVLDISDRARRIVTIWETDARATFDLRDLVAERIGRLHESHPGASVSATVPEGLAVETHVALPRAVDELLENAVVHTPPDADVEVTAAVPRPGRVALRVADTGGGMDPLELEALFRREETQLTHGRGLGLWLVYWIVRKSGGDLSFGEGETGGTVVEMSLPAADQADATASRTAS